MNESSQPTELLLSVSKDARGTLGSQIEGQLRSRIRDGALRAGTPLPSTRDLARQLGISRRVVVDAYGQLTAEGYLSVRQGARPRVAAPAVGASPAPAGPPPGTTELRFDFRPSMPDVTTFPRAVWARCLRTAATTITDADLSYGDPRGVEALRVALADYLGRVRGVVAATENVVITSGYTQALAVVCRALAETGARHIALESPADPEYGMIAARAGLDPVSVAVDADGIQVDLLRAANPDAVAVTPAHQHPTGAVLSSARRTDLVAWLRERGAIAVEDDYDAEYRYDRAPIGAMQGLAPDLVAYAGTASKTLAPGLRLGWLVLPRDLVDDVADIKRLADRGSPVLDQLAFADFVDRGEFDRHLRRMRPIYRRRRDTLLAALRRHAPELEPAGIAAGLHLVAYLPDGVAEPAVVEAAARRGLALHGLAPYRISSEGRAGLIFGYATLGERALSEGAEILAEAIADVSSR